MFGAAIAAEPILLPAVEPWLAAEKLQREHDAVGFYLSAHPLDEYASVLQKMRVQTWAEFTESVRRGATAGRLAGTVTARQERRMRTGNRMAAVQLSDPTGSYEGVLFSEGLTEFATCSSPAARWWCWSAPRTGRRGSMSASSRSSRSTSSWPASSRSASSSATRRRCRASRSISVRKGEGAVSFILMLEEGHREVEVSLPGRYAITPQIASALRAVKGVVQVELV